MRSLGTLFSLALVLLISACSILPDDYASGPQPIYSGPRFANNGGS